jgi:predicted small secreted protein
MRDSLQGRARAAVEADKRLDNSAGTSSNWFRSLLGFDHWFLEVVMRDRKHGLASLLLVLLMLTGGASILSACNTVAGAGQDVSTVGNAVSSGAEQTRRATGLP